MNAGTRCTMLVTATMITALTLPANGADVDVSKFAPLPPIESVTPRDNPSTPEKIELGRLLYFDSRLAGDSSKSCASCHIPADGWAKSQQLSDAYPGTKHWRSVPTVLNAAYMKNLFWDGRADSLEAQCKGPMEAPIEMNQSPIHLIPKLEGIPEYVKRFKEVFDSDITYDNIAKAISAFERTVVSKNVPFDNYLKGDKSALDDEQIEGLKLFVGKANCVACHFGPMLTDDKFHAIGVPETEALKKEADRIATRHFFARANAYRDPKLGYRIDGDYGREIITKKAEDRHKFKTPSLREISITPPYMHNGKFISLEEVVDFYNDGGGDIKEKDPLIKPLKLTSSEKQALIAFLESLTGDEIIVDPPELPKKSDGSF